ncbi:putative uncharacterized protein DDB_G0290521 [Liolophura sinensis]|uniref:putative uncharacterized protein DDB_G0290521 n=1 Tax=Liolophura sinensis TaxID=3198878 RepID=UPI003158F35B
MALVEPRLLETLTRPSPSAHPPPAHPNSPYPVPSTVKALNTLDQEMASILHDRTLSDEEKIQRYHHTLQRYRTFQDQYQIGRRPSSIPPQAKSTASRFLSEADKAMLDTPTQTLQPTTPTIPTTLSPSHERSIPRDHYRAWVREKMSTPAELGNPPTELGNHPIARTPTSQHKKKPRPSTTTSSSTHTPHTTHTTHTTPKRPKKTRRGQRSELRPASSIIRPLRWSPY